MKRRAFMKTRTLFILLIVLLLNSSLVFAAENEVKVYHYVALGDSLTAGYEPWMKEEWEETQIVPIPYGFVERIHEQALFHGRTVSKNYGVIGLTSKGLMNLLQAVQETKHIAASELQERILDPRTDEILSQYREIRADIEKADLITITIGANDFTDLLTLLNEKSTQELQTIVNDRIVLYKENLTHSLEILYALNPNINIVIADQYQPYPKLGNQEIFTALSGYNEQLTLALEEVVEKFVSSSSSIHIAYVGERFVGKELAYVNINLLEQEKSDTHPKQRGYEEMAKVFAEALWGEYKTVSTSDPIGIVVNGKELQTPYMPILENGTTYVPVREYVEALGGVVEWDPVSSSAIANFNGLIVKYTANSNLIEVNGKVVEMKASVRLIHVDPNNPNAKTYVPLRALAEDGLQLDVQYIPKSKIAYINP